MHIHLRTVTDISQKRSPDKSVTMKLSQINYKVKCGSEMLCQDDSTACVESRCLLETEATVLKPIECSELLGNSLSIDESKIRALF